MISFQNCCCSFTITIDSSSGKIAMSSNLPLCLIYSWQKSILNFFRIARVWKLAIIGRHFFVIRSKLSRQNKGNLQLGLRKHYQLLNGDLKPHLHFISFQSSSNFARFYVVYPLKLWYVLTCFVGRILLIFWTGSQISPPVGWWLHARCYFSCPEHSRYFADLLLCYPWW